jgi:hypothetical protein
VRCDACVDGHIAEIVYAERDRAFIRCERNGLIPFDPIHSRRWQITLAAIADAFSPSNREVMKNRIYQLNDLPLPGMAFLARGLLWRDGDRMLRAIRSTAGSGLVTVLVPALAPSGDVPDMLFCALTGHLSVGGGRLLPAPVKPPVVLVERIGSLAADDISAALGELKHAADYREVFLQGRWQKLSVNRARVVELLDKHRLSGVPSLAQDYILSHLDIESKTLFQVFRGCWAWNTLIVKAPGHGHYALNSLAFH